MHPVDALFRRNAWATGRLLTYCADRPGVAAAPAQPDVYGDIGALFNHIVAAETRYLRLLTGVLPDDRVVESHPRTLAGLKDATGRLADRWTAVLATDRDVENVTPYQRGDDPEVMADWVPLVQSVHHGDDHRTQVETLLSRHGVESPGLDGWTFGEQHTETSEPREWWSSLLRRFLGHHVWATTCLLEFCASLPPGQLTFSAPGTYGEIGATLAHLVSADRSYVSRLLGEGPKPALGAEGPARLAEYFAGDAERWVTYLDSGPDFEAAIPRRQGGIVPAWVVVLQAVHHGNDHRTHAGTALLRNRVAGPSLDVWEYAIAEGALRPLGT